MSNTYVQTLSRPVWGPGVGNPMRRLLAIVVAWQQRYALRRHLLELDDRLLDDIGFDRAKARQEAARPFWKD